MGYKHIIKANTISEKKKGSVLKNAAAAFCGGASSGAPTVWRFSGIRRFAAFFSRIRRDGRAFFTTLMQGTCSEDLTNANTISEKKKFTTNIKYTSEPMIEGRYRRGREIHRGLRRDVTAMIDTDGQKIETDFDAAVMFDNLNICKAPHVCRVISVENNFLFLNEKVEYSLMTKILDLYQTYTTRETSPSLRGKSWIEVSGLHIRKLFRGLALGMMSLHEHELVFDGGLRDVVITHSGSKIAKALKPVSGEFHKRRIRDIRVFVRLITRCLTLPSYGGSFKGKNDGLCERIAVGCGLTNQDCWFLDQLEAHKKQIVDTLPSSIVLDHPYMFGVAECRVFFRKLNMEVLTTNKCSTWTQLDTEVKKQNFFWKSMVKTSLVTQTLKEMDKHRIKSHRGVPTINLGRDLVKLPWNADKHRRNNQPNVKMSGDDVYKVVDADLGGGIIIFIYGILIDHWLSETRNGTDNWLEAFNILRSTNVEKTIWEE